jgi:hypothetical protein
MERGYRAWAHQRSIPSWDGRELINAGGTRFKGSTKKPGVSRRDTDYQKLGRSLYTHKVLSKAAKGVCQKKAQAALSIRGGLLGSYEQS